jgi:lipopolysaccharide export system protein LptA
MACKFHALMTIPKIHQISPVDRTLLGVLATALTGLLLAALAPTTAHAERADRLKPATVVADQEGQIDLQKQVVVFSGNVVVTKGTMVIRAARVEVRQLPNGYVTAIAYGAPNKPATFRQKRDGAD